MGEVDQNDLLTRLYCDKRKTIKMWKKVVFNLFQRHMINVYIINTKISKTILRFVEDVNDALAKEFEDAERFQRRLTPKAV